MIGKLLELLRKEDPERVIHDGFHKPHSYRGIYSELGVEPAQNVKVKEMIEALEFALANTFEAYKGGEYTYGEYNDVYLANWGSCGEMLGPTLMGYMLREAEAAALRTERDELAAAGEQLRVMRAAVGELIRIRIPMTIKNGQSALKLEPTTAEQTARENAEKAAMLDWWLANPLITLCLEDSDFPRWEATEETGPINDRQWKVIARGATPLECLTNARAAKEQEGGK